MSGVFASTKHHKQMSNDMIKTSLGEIAAKNLADVTKTPAYNGSLSPRWLLRLLPWANTVAGQYRVNRVKVVGDEFSNMMDIHEDKADTLSPENLKKIPALGGVSKEALLEMAKKFKKKSYASGDLIFKEGQAGEELYIVVSGKVDIFTEDGDGKTLVLNTLQSGHFFGERSLHAQKPRNASARAISSTEVLELDGKARKDLMKKFPKMNLGMKEAAAQMEEIEGSKMQLMTVNGVDLQQKVGHFF